jgi:hypothetical protein
MIGTEFVTTVNDRPINCRATSSASLDHCRDRLCDLSLLLQSGNRPILERSHRFPDVSRSTSCLLDLADSVEIFHIPPCCRLADPKMVNKLLKGHKTLLFDVFQDLSSTFVKQHFRSPCFVTDSLSFAVFQVAVIFSSLKQPPCFTIWHCLSFVFE